MISIKKYRRTLLVPSRSYFGFKLNFLYLINLIWKRIGLGPQDPKSGWVGLGWPSGSKFGSNLGWVGRVHLATLLLKPCGLWTSKSSWAPQSSQAPEYLLAPEHFSYTYSTHNAHFGSWKNLRYVNRALVETRPGWNRFICTICKHILSLFYEIRLSNKAWRSL